MKVYRWLWILIAALLATNAVAAPADPSEAQNGDFGGKLLLTNDPEGFWREWEKPEPPTVTTTLRVTQARPVHAMVVFHDCKAGSNGKCDVVVRFEIRRPDGALYDESKTAPAWNSAPAPGHNLLASMGSLGFRLEPEDPLGRYQIFATVTDQVANRSITLIQNVTAEAESTQPQPVS